MHTLTPVLTGSRAQCDHGCRAPLPFHHRPSWSRQLRHEPDPTRDFEKAHKKPVLSGQSVFVQARVWSACPCSAFFQVCWTCFCLLVQQHMFCCFVENTRIYNFRWRAAQWRSTQGRLTTKICFLLMLKEIGAILPNNPGELAQVLTIEYNQDTQHKAQKGKHKTKMLLLKLAQSHPHTKNKYIPSTCDLETFCAFIGIVWLYKTILKTKHVMIFHCIPKLLPNTELYSCCFHWPSDLKAI